MLCAVNCCVSFVVCWCLLCSGRCVRFVVWCVLFVAACLVLVLWFVVVVRVAR